MVKRITVTSTKKEDLIDITGEIRRVIRESGVMKGICHVFVPHTTAAVTVNENTDPGVKVDILDQLNAAVPRDKKFLHKEGNAHAHIKATLVGPNVTLFVENGKIVLGTWQAIYFCEFDGPRSRNVLVKIA